MNEDTKTTGVIQLRRGKCAACQEQTWIGAAGVCLKCVVIEFLRRPKQ